MIVSFEILLATYLLIVTSPNKSATKQPTCELFILLSRLVSAILVGIKGEIGDKTRNRGIKREIGG